MTAWELVAKNSDRDDDPQVSTMRLATGTGWSYAIFTRDSYKGLTIGPVWFVPDLSPEATTSQSGAPSKEDQAAHLFDAEVFYEDQSYIVGGIHRTRIGLRPVGSTPLLFVDVGAVKFRP